MEKLLVAKNISKIYGRFTDHPFEALKPTSLEISEGEFVCVMGPSGAGKSTLLSILGTLDVPTGGKLFVDDKEIRVYGGNELGVYRNHHMGFIFQDFNLLDSLTVAQNIEVPLIIDGKTDNRARIEEVAKKCNILEILDKYPTECSGGQKQRVSVCRGIVNDPKIIIADEPTGNLDSENSKAVLKIFQQMNAEGKSVVMVTHDTMIASYSTRTLYVLDGEITEEVVKGDMSTEEYYDRLVALSEKEAAMLGGII